MARPANEALFAEHAPALRNFLGARCRDPDLAAELLQETAARLVAAGPRLDPNGNARGYLFRIAANVWRDHLRREIVRRRGTEAWSREEPPRTPDADEAVLASELRAAVRRAIAELPPAHLVACADCRARLEAIERARVAADWVLASRAVPRRGIPRAVGLGALAAAAVLAVLWLWPLQRPLPLSLAVPRYAAPGLAPIDSILTRLEQENL